MYAPVVPSNPDQNEQSVFRPKRPKILPFGAAHTYMAYIREYSPPPPRPPPVLTPLMIVRDQYQV